MERTHFRVKVLFLISNYVYAIIIIIIIIIIIVVKNNYIHVTMSFKI